MTAREGMMPMQSIIGRLQSGCRACLSGGTVFVSALTLTFMLTMTSAFMPGAVGLALAADWNPAAFAEEDTLEFFTVNAEGEEHWATVWFVLIDGEPYIRLGARAQERITENINRPIVRIRVGGQTYEDIRVEEVPEIRDLAQLSSQRDHGPGIVIPFATEIDGRNFFGKGPDLPFGNANFSILRNIKIRH